MSSRSPLHQIEIVALIGIWRARQKAMDLILVLTLIPASLGLALALQLGALKLIVWALHSRI